MNAAVEMSSRQLALELGLKGGAKAELKRRLRQIDKPGSKRSPSMILCEVTEIDDDGEIWAQSTSFPGLALLVLSDRPGTAPKPGDKLLAKPSRQEDGTAIAQLFKLLPKSPTTSIGVLQKTSSGLILLPSRKGG